MRTFYDPTIISSTESTTMTQTPHGPQVRSETTEVHTGMHCVIDACSLRRLLRNAMLFTPARKLSWIHDLKATRLEVRGTDLTAVTSDSVVIARETAALRTAPTAGGQAPTVDGVFVLRRADARILIDLLARDQYSDVTLTVTETSNSLEWAEPRGKRKAVGDTTVTRVLAVEVCDSAAPAKVEFAEYKSEPMTTLGRVFQEELDKHDAVSWEQVTFEAGRLARFSRVVPVEPDLGMEIELAGSKKPAKIQIGARFTALLKPLAMAGGNPAAEQPADSAAI